MFLLIFCGVRCSDCGGAGNLGCAMLGQLQWEALWALGKRLVSTYCFHRERHTHTDEHLTRERRERRWRLTS